MYIHMFTKKYGAFICCHVIKKPTTSELIKPVMEIAIVSVFFDHVRFCLPL